MDLGSNNFEDLEWRNSNYINNNYVHGYNLHEDRDQHMLMGGGGFQIHVVLHNIKGDKVAIGTIQEIEASDSLKRLVLSPSEEPIFIEEVYVPSEEVYELSLYNMGYSYNKVIRWPRELVKELAHFAELGEQFV
jgi:hypothetical protein